MISLADARHLWSALKATEFTTLPGIKGAAAIVGLIGSVSERDQVLIVRSPATVILSAFALKAYYG